MVADVLEIKPLNAFVMQGLTTLLYPINVLKTRQMASDNVSGGFKVSFDAGTWLKISFHEPLVP